MQTQTVQTQTVDQAAAGQLSVPPAEDASARPKGRPTAFHRSSYSELPGAPVTTDTEPAMLEFPRGSRCGSRRRRRLRSRRGSGSGDVVCLSSCRGGAVRLGLGVGSAFRAGGAGVAPRLSHGVGGAFRPVSRSSGALEPHSQDTPSVPELPSELAGLALAPVPAPERCPPTPVPVVRLEVSGASCAGVAAPGDRVRFDAGRHAFVLEDDKPGTLLVSGPGSVNVVRAGAGAGDAIRTGSGDGHAVRDGRGYGDAHRLGSGSGDAVVRGRGLGDAIVGGSASGTVVSLRSRWRRLQPFVPAQARPSAAEAASAAPSAAAGLLVRRSVTAMVMATRGVTARLRAIPSGSAPASAAWRCGLRAALAVRSSSRPSAMRSRRAAPGGLPRRRPPRRSPLPNAAIRSATGSAARSSSREVAPISWTG